MEPFLKQLTAHLYKKFGDQTGTLTLVFPNRRPAAFIRKYLAGYIHKPLWMPHILTVHELMEELSSLRQPDEVTLITTLYEIYKEEKKTGETLDHFYYWGEVMLNDFNDIDNYMVNAADLFKNLSMLKSFEGMFDYLTPEQIEAIKNYWKHFDPELRSRHKEEFIEIWKIMGTVYSRYREKLKTAGLGYAGMIFRETAEKAILPQDKTFVFAGFNALNRCEHQVFTRFKQTGNALFFWDYDEQYIHDPLSEAGLFMRKNLKDFPPENIEGLSFNGLSDRSKKIHLIAVPSVTGQTLLLPEILGNKDIQSDTAIVLADESLLPAVLSSIPETVSGINITMGYPLSLSPVYSFIQALVDLQRNGRRIGEKTWYNHKPVLTLLNHQYIRLCYADESAELCRKIADDNAIYIEEETLTGLNTGAPLFTLLSDEDDLSSYILNLLQMLIRRINEPLSGTPDMTRDFIFHAVKGINRFKDLIGTTGLLLSTDAKYRLLLKILRNIRIPFAGEPLRGLQVIGLMETRLLDFNHVIVLSANEGILPKTNITPSYIPYNLRKGFGLPTIEHQDAIFSYYFYRLLQRASHCTLVYATGNETTRQSEMSRFLYQLKYDSAFTIHEKQVVFRVNTLRNQTIVIHRNPETIKKMERFSAVKGNDYLSASAVNTFLSCPLKFYFRYISQIDEPTSVTEDVDAAMFGNLLHHCIHHLYMKAGSAIISAEWLKNTAHNLPLLFQLTDKAFEEIFFNRKNNPASKHGRNIIIREVLVRYLQNILSADAEYAPFSMVTTENQYITTMALNNPIGEVRLGGRIDRIDQKNQIIRVIDYKTGEIKTSILSLDLLWSPSKTNPVILQMLFYAMLYAPFAAKENKVIMPRVYSIRNLDEEYSGLITINKKTVKDFSDVSQAFRNGLSALLNEIFDPSLPFTQTEDAKTCESCIYNSICRR